MSFRKLCFFSLTAIMLCSFVLARDANGSEQQVDSSSISEHKQDEHFSKEKGFDFSKKFHNYQAMMEKHAMAKEFHKNMHLRGKDSHNVVAGNDHGDNGVWGEIRHDSNPKQHHHHKHAKKNSWMDGFIHSTIMIVSMEFMDKTFFISAIMSMTHNKWIILIGSVAALFLMNGISCVMGVVLPMFMSRRVTVFVAAILFIFFGGKMILDGIKMDNNDTGELDEAQEEIKSNLRIPSDHTTEDSPLLLSPTTEEKMCKLQDSVIVQIFLMIFFAEWGDRSQVSTILLAGTHPVFSVFCGGCVGYFITSFVAVLCGSVLQKWISPRWITIFGGLMFILFAFQTVLGH